MAIVSQEVAKALYLSNDYRNAPEKEQPDSELREIIYRHREALMKLPTQLYGIRLVEEELELPLLPHVFSSPVKAARWVKKEYKGMQYSIVSVKVD